MASPPHSRPAFADTIWPSVAGVGALVLVFLAACWPFMKKLGIEVDEALLGNGIYEHAAPWYSWHLFGSELPVMLMTYVGALKTWLYNPIFAIWTPGPVSLRLPMVLLGAFTVVLFFLLVDRAVGRRAAWIGTALLATDPSFILTETIDLGFVALQQAFKLGALLALIAYHRRPSRVRLAIPFFLFGLAVWDKAVFVWILAAFACAGAIVFWPEVRSHLSAGHVLVAGLAFTAGALPFVIYNLERPFETFSQNAHLAPDNPTIKLALTKRTLDGSGLFGFLTAPDSGPRPVAPRGLIQHVTFGMNWLFGVTRTDWIGWALLATLAATPFVWRGPSRRPLEFSLIFLGITWLQMFFTAGAGGAVHHLILLWPFHLLVIAIVLTELAKRLGRFALPAIVTLTAVLCFTNLLVVNQYFVTVVRDGPGVRWTDAFPQLESWLYEAKMKNIFISDWGIQETLNLMSEGELPVQDASFALRSVTEPKYRQQLTQLLTAGKSIWVTHSLYAEQWSGTRAALLHLTESLGYSQEMLQTINDRNGRPIFEIFRFRAAH